ncbi:predicted protein [Postia placenta Mad-698-R]|nr:predicted protein [Postia placenta Mad-698-R]
MARECLEESMRFKNVEEARRIKVDVSGGGLRRWGGPVSVYIEGADWKDGRGPIPHLATFASRFAGRCVGTTVRTVRGAFVHGRSDARKGQSRAGPPAPGYSRVRAFELVPDHAGLRVSTRWSRVKDLWIYNAVWRARDLDLDAVVRDLAAFAITELHLYDVIFPSILTFGRLLCALPRLKRLILHHVQFTQHPLDASAFSRFHLLLHMQLETLDLDHGRDDSELRPSFVELVELMAAVSNRRCLAPPANFAQASLWRAVRRLILGYVTFPSVTTFVRLLCAFPALEDLRLHKPYAFVKHGFDLRSVPVHPGLPSHLADVELTFDFHCYSDSCSVIDLVDLFIATGLSENLRRITIHMSSSSRITTVCDAALNRLVKHSQSLQHLSFMPPLLFSVSPEADEWVHVDHSAAPYFDVSSDTCLERLDLTVDVDHEDISHLCARVIEILSQVTSAHMTRIQIFFGPLYHPDTELDVDLGQLMDGLPQLDAILSRPIFDSLTDVIVFIGTLDRCNARDEDLAQDLRLCLPTVNARGILGIMLNRIHLSSMGLDWDEETGEWRSHRIERVSAQDAVVTDAGAGADNDRRTKNATTVTIPHDDSDVVSGTSQPVWVPPVVYADAQTPSSSNSTDAQVPADSACDDELILQNATAGLGASVHKFAPDDHGTCTLVHSLAPAINEALVWEIRPSEKAEAVSQLRRCMSCANHCCFAESIVVRPVRALTAALEDVVDKFQEMNAYLVSTVARQTTADIPLILRYSALHTMVRPFPTEIWLDIFEGLAEEGEYDSLERCRVVCREFFPMARECLKESMRFKNVEEVERIKVDVSDGGNQEDGRRPIPHLATFASRLAGRWPRVKELSITDAVWRARDLDLDAVVRDLAASTITKLRVINIILPSILTFGRLLCALPHLKKLTLCDVQFSQHPLVAGSISRLHLLPRTQLKTLYLTDGRDDSELRPSFVELVDLMAAVSPWNAVRSLALDHVTFPSVITFAHLLCALPALKSLKLEDLYAFVKHGFDLTSVPVLPGLPSHLADVHLGNNLRSDTCSVADLVDFFIATGLSENLRRITACLSSSPRVTTVCDAALNRLVKHSQSLRHLSLHQSSFGAAPYFDVSSNTYLERLDLTVDVDHEHIPHLCAPVIEILSQVTSAHISRIQVNFWPCYLLGVKFDVDLGELMDGLPQLDVMFSRPIFNNLTDVIIHIRTLDRRNVRDKELAHSLQLCLPALNARGILSIGLDWNEEMGEWRSHRSERVSAQDAVVTDAGADADNDRRTNNAITITVPHGDSDVMSGTYADAQTPSSSNPTDAQVPAESACDDKLVLQNATASSVYPWTNLRQTITLIPELLGLTTSG